MDQSHMLDAVSQAIAGVYRGHYTLDATSVSSYLAADDLLVCVLEDLSVTGDQAADGAGDGDGEPVDPEETRRDFQRHHEAEFREAVERATGRSVKTFLSANHVADGVAAEVFFLTPAART